MDTAAELEAIRRLKYAYFARWISSSSTSWARS